MVNFLIGLAVGAVLTFLVMYFLRPAMLKDKITGEVTAIVHHGRTFVDSAVKKL